MMFDLCIKNGELIPIVDAQMPVTSIEFAYGFGVYENIRVVHGHPLFLSEHLERLMESAKRIGLQHQRSEAELSKWISALLKAINADSINLKILLIGGREAASATFFILPLAPHFPEKKLYRDGVQTITVSYERSIPDAKTLSMLGSFLAYRQAKEKGAYDALLINHKGAITEGTRTNFFVLKGKTVIGAPRSEILEGVTMRHVLAVAKEQGFSCEEGLIKPSELSKYDGAFLTSTSSKIMPIGNVDNQILAIPDSLKILMKAFDEHLDTILRY